jgi:hypothetical protein
MIGSKWDMLEKAAVKFELDKIMEISLLTEPHNLHKSPALSTVRSWATQA